MHKYGLTFLLMCSAMANSAAGPRVIEVSSTDYDPALCPSFSSLIASNFNRSKAQPPEAHCGRHLLSAGVAGFTEPDWQPVPTDAWSMQTVEQFWRAQYEYQFRRPTFDWQLIWTDWIHEATLETKLDDGLIHMDRASFDIDSDGEPEDVWRLDVVGCKDGETIDSEPNYPRIAIRKSDGSFDPHATLPNSTAGTNVVMWQGRVFVVEFLAPDMYPHKMSKTRPSTGFVAELRQLGHLRSSSYHTLWISPQRCIVRSTKDLPR
jgi:hypothetical protein